MHTRPSTGGLARDAVESARRAFGEELAAARQLFLVRGFGKARVHPQPPKQLHLTVHYEDAGDGWIVATVAEVPGAITQGRSRAEARDNIIDALETLLTPDELLAGAAPTPDDEPLTLTVS